MNGPAVTVQRPESMTRAMPVVSLRPRRRPWLLVGALLSMVVSAGGFVLVYLGADDREQVLVVARSVAAGQNLSEADLRVAAVVPAPGVSVLPAADVARVVGRPAAVPLVPGTLLTRAQLGPAAWPAAGQVVVAVPVKPGRLAAGVVPGAQVLAIPVAADPAGTGVTAADASAPRSAPGAGPPAAPISGLVVAVTAGVDGSGTTVVSLLVARADAVPVASASGDLSLALVRE